MRRASCRLFAGLLLSTAGALPALAASPSEDLATAWLEAMVPAGASVEIGATSYDAATGTVTFDGVSIASGAAAPIASFGTVSIVDPFRTASGDFSAHSLSLGDGTLTAAFAPMAGMGAGDAAAAETRTVVTFDSVLVERPVVPASLRLPTAKDSVSVWVARIGEMVTAVSSGHVEFVNLVSTTEGLPDGPSTSSYAYFNMSGIHEGRIEWLGYSGYRETASFPDASFQPSPLTIDVASAMSYGTDLGALFAAVDPAQYENGAGDREWRSVSLRSTFTDLALTVDGQRFTVGRGESTGLRVRQTERSVVELIEQAIRSPEAIEADPFPFVQEMSESLFGLLALESLTLGDIDLSLTDFGTLTIDEIALNDMDGDGIGAFRVEGIAYDGGMLGSGALQSLAVQDIVYGEIMGLVEKYGKDPAYQPSVGEITEALPQVGWVAATGFTATPAGGTDEVGFTEIAFTGSDFLGGLARQNAISVVQAYFPTSLIEEPQVRDQLAALGLGTVSFDLGLSLDWDTEAGTYTIENSTLRVPGVGNLSFAAVLGDLPLSLFEDPMMAEARMMDVTLVSAALRFGNEGIVEGAYDAYARQTGTTPDALQRDVAAMVTLGLSSQPALRPVLEQPVADFLADPRSFTLSVAPSEPVTFGALEAMTPTDDLAARLNVEATANQ